MLLSMSDITRWKELSRTVFFEKYNRRIDKVIYKLPDGSKADFYIQDQGPTVCMLAMTPEDHVILVREYRPGPDRIVAELPGGFVNKGEHHLTAAEREFREETGYVGDFEYVGPCLDDAYSTMMRYAYVVKNARKVTETSDTPTEHTKVTTMHISEFRKHLRTGMLTDVEIGYLGLDHLGLL